MSIFFTILIFYFISFTFFLLFLISDTNAPYIQRTLIVEEGKTLNLSCAATGNPMPHVEWRRDDGRTINVHGVESK